MSLNNLVKRLQDIMRNDAGINGDAQRIEQMVWILFLKVYDAKEEVWEFYNENYVSIIPEELRWRNWAVDNRDGKALTGDALLDFVNNKLFPKYNASQQGIPYITGASNIEAGKVIINRWTENGRAFAYKGDLLITCKGTVGTMAVLLEEQVHIARQIMAIRPYCGIDLTYLQLVLDTLVAGLKAAAKSMIPGIAREDVLYSLIPIPPYAEQKRIVLGV